MEDEVHFEVEHVQGGDSRLAFLHEIAPHLRSSRGGEPPPLRGQLPGVHLVGKVDGGGCRTQNITESVYSRFLSPYG